MESMSAKNPERTLRATNHMGSWYFICSLGSIEKLIRAKIRNLPHGLALKDCFMPKESLCFLPSHNKDGHGMIREPRSQI